MPQVSVHVMVLEATARTQFMRYCPKSMACLGAMAKGEQAFLFDGFHSQAWGSTSANMIPFLTGTTFQTQMREAQRTTTKDCDNSFALDVKDEQKLWKILQKQGYVTGFAAPLANHVMGTRTCSWAHEFDAVAPIMGCQARPNQALVVHASGCRCL